MRLAAKRILRHGDWKLLMDDDGGHKALFKLTTDRAETNNLAAIHLK